MARIDELFPDQREEVRWCRYHSTLQWDAALPERFRAMPTSCRLVPYCVVRTQDRNKRLALEWRDRCWRCTPPGQPIRMFHAVVMGPTGSPDTWGYRARKDLATFRGYGVKFLEELLGPGLGGAMAYQDFGNNPFHKANPHLTIVVNRYALVDGNVRKVPVPSWTPARHAKRRERSARLSMVFDLDAAWPSNFDGRSVIEAAGSAYKLLSYRLREMVDFRDFVYRGDGVVYDRDCRSQWRKRTTVEGFNRWILDYDGRFRPHRADAPRARVQAWERVRVLVEAGVEGDREGVRRGRRGASCVASSGASLALVPKARSKDFLRAIRPTGLAA